MFRKQYNSSSTKSYSSGELFPAPSMTEPDNAMSIPEILARYSRGHGLAVQVLPASSDEAALEDGYPFQDDVDMFSEDRQAALAAEAAKAAESESETKVEDSTN